MISKKFFYFLVLILFLGFQRIESITEQNSNNIEKEFQAQTNESDVNVNVQIKIEMNKLWETQKNEILAAKVEIKNLLDDQKNGISNLREEMKTSLANQTKELSAFKEQTQKSFNSQNQNHAKFEEQLKRIEAALIPIKKSQFDKNFNCIENCGVIKDLPNDCSEVKKEQEQENGVFVLKPPKESKLKPFGVFCLNRDNKNWTIIQRRFPNNSLSFNRTWEEYKNGFGDSNGNYWIGLDRIHQLTANKNYEIWFDRKANDGGYWSDYYSQFSVADESNGYKVKVDGFSGDLNYFQNFNGSKFSTYDNDNNGDETVNCAQNRGGGWWYDSKCYHVVFNGITYKGYYVHMAIRPI